MHRQPQSKRRSRAVATFLLATVSVAVFCAGCTTVDGTSTADGADGFCLDDESRADTTFTWVVAHQVVDGELAEVCTGEANETVERAWQILSDLTPPAQLNDLAVFAGYEPNGAEASDTLAFVSSADEQGSVFQMAVNIAAANESQDEFTLTMAHEFSHVFNSTPNQLDRTVGPDACQTYYNGEGCHIEDALMVDWVDRFWPQWIDTFDPFADQADNESDGETRCIRDRGFFGSYAASTPEEDFAESFSAFVLRVEALTDEQQDRLDWFEQFPGMVEFRDRAIERGYGPQPHEFNECGLR